MFELEQHPGEVIVDEPKPKRITALDDRKRGDLRANREATYLMLERHRSAFSDVDDCDTKTLDRVNENCAFPNPSVAFGSKGKFEIAESPLGIADGTIRTRSRTRPP